MVVSQIFENFSPHLPLTWGSTLSPGGPSPSPPYPSNLLLHFFPFDDSLVADNLTQTNVSSPLPACLFV